MLRRLVGVVSAAVLGVLAVQGATPAAAAPSAAADRPVVVVAGTFGPAFFYEPLAKRLRADGHRVAIFQLTSLGTVDIRRTAKDLAAFVADYRASTGAASVDLVAHSQGGLVARQYIKSEGGAGKVGSLVNIAAPNYGTIVANIADFFGGGNCLTIVACQQMQQGSSFVNQLNDGTDTPGGVRYTNLYTTFDELVRPVNNARLGDGATNVLIQSQCPYRVVAHAGLALDGTTYDGIEDALRGRPVQLNCYAV